MGGTGAPGGTPRLRAKPWVSLRVSSTCGYHHVSEEQQGTWKRPTLGPDRGRAVNGQRAESQESVLVPSNCQGATGRCTCEVLALGPGPYGTRAHLMPNLAAKASPIWPFPLVAALLDSSGPFIGRRLDNALPDAENG